MYTYSNVNPKVTKTVTTTREYDKKGNLVKETVTETFYEENPPYTVTWNDTATNYIQKNK